MLLGCVVTAGCAAEYGHSAFSPDARSTSSPAVGLDTADAAVTAMDSASELPNLGYIYFTDYVDDVIRRVRPDGTALETLAVLSDGYMFGLAVDSSRRSMYWADYIAARLHRADIDGGNPTALIAVGLGRPNSVIVDSATGELYITDSALQQILVCKADGTQLRTLVVNAGAAFGIALDEQRGHIYWADAAGNRLRRADRDGSNVVDVRAVGMTKPRGIALDLTAQHVYWAEHNTGTIKRANLDGSEPEVVVSGLGTLNEIAIDLATKELYWVEASPGRLARVNVTSGTVATVVANLGAPRGLSLVFE